MEYLLAKTLLVDEIDERSAKFSESSETTDQAVGIPPNE